MEILVINVVREAIKMLEPEMLALLGCGAVLPYVSEALWNWVKTRISHL